MHTHYHTFKLLTIALPHLQIYRQVSLTIFTKAIQYAIQTIIVGLQKKEI